jgi:hypothetical protein
MPNIQGQQSILLSDFSFGELTPRMLGRTETEVYHKGAQTIQNFVPMIQGGFRKRTGTLQIGNAHAANPRLVKMTISGSLFYILEFTNLYMQIWKNGMTLVTQANITNYAAIPYLTAELNALQFAWASPNLFIAHAAHPPVMLTYTGGGTADTFTFVMPIPLVGSAACYIPAVTLTNPNAYFPITAGQLAALSLNVLQVFTVTANATTTLSLVTPNPQNLYWQLPGKYIVIAGDSTPRQVNYVTSNSIVLQVATSVTGSNIAAYAANTGVPVTAIYNGASMLPAGCYLTSITGTQVNISAAPAATQAGCTVAISQDISLNAPILPFQGTKNYPSVVACANQRVIWGSSLNNPQEVWASVVGIWDSYGNMEMQFFELVTYTSQQIATNSSGQPIDASGNLITAALQNTPAYVNVTQTTEVVGDSDGYNGQIYSDQNDAVQWIVSSLDIIMGTLSGQIEVDGSSTANTYAFRNVSRTGCAPIQGYFMTGGILFIDRAAKRVLLLNWQGTQVITPPPETLSLFSEHLFEQDPITQVAYSASPVMRLWFLRTSGTLVCCEYDDQYGVRAWWQYQTTGTIISMAVGSVSTEDVLFLAILRGSNTVIEQLTTPYWNPSYYSGTGGNQPPIFLDCAVQKYNATPFSTVTTTDCPLLSNLQGQTVGIWADGAYLGTLAYVSGTITLPGSVTATYVVIGLPYTSTLTTMPFELGNQMDSTQAQMQNTPRVGVTLLNSLDCQLSGKVGGLAQNAIPIASQTANPTLFTGTKRAAVASGIGYEAAITVKSTKPLPCTVTALVPMVGNRERGGG